MTKFYIRGLTKHDVYELQCFDNIMTGSLECVTVAQFLPLAMRAELDKTSPKLWVWVQIAMQWDSTTQRSMN